MLAQMLPTVLTWHHQSVYEARPWVRNLSSPNGPFTVIVFLTVGLYEVATLDVFKSLMDSSTPGGIEIGVRPSFEGRFVVVEKCRCADVCHAGNRNPGSATCGFMRSAWPNAFPLAGTNLEAIEICLCRGNGWEIAWTATDSLSALGAGELFGRLVIPSRVPLVDSRMRCHAQLYQHLHLLALQIY